MPRSSDRGFFLPQSFHLSATPSPKLEVNGNIATNVNNSLPTLVMDSSGSGDNWTSQGAWIAIGESGISGAASMHMTYRGDGYGFIGSGTVSNAEPGASYFRFDYNANHIYTPDNIGIGSATPTVALDVVGTVIASGSVYWGDNETRTETKNDAGTAATKSGFFQTAAPVNFYTSASGWQHLIEARHTNDANNYALQLAGGFFDQDLYFRKTNNSSTTTWSQVATKAYVDASAGGSYQYYKTTGTTNLTVFTTVISITGPGVLTAVRMKGSAASQWTYGRVTVDGVQITTGNNQFAYSTWEYHDLWGTFDTAANNAYAPQVPLNIHFKNTLVVELDCGSTSWLGTAEVQYSK